MSMTISTENYLNGAYLNRKTSGTEQPEPKDTEKAGELQPGAEPSGRQNRSAVSRTDTVEISEEGRAASAKLQQRRTDAAAEGGYEAEDLSEYSDTELKQMYYNGEITLQEYEDETGETLS